MSDVEEDCAPDEICRPLEEFKFQTIHSKIVGDISHQPHIFRGTKLQEESIVHSTDSFPSKDFGYGSCGSNATDSLRKELEALQIRSLHGSIEEEPQKGPFVCESRTDSGFHFSHELSTPEQAPVSSVTNVCQYPPVQGSQPSQHPALLPACFEPDEDGDTQLHIAVIKENTPISLQILDLCPVSYLLDQQNDYRQTPLHLATLTGLHIVARRLVCQGARLDLCDHNGNTPLHIACKTGDIQLVRCLTDPVTQVEVQNFPHPVYSQQIPQDFSIRNYDGFTCLHLAAFSSYNQIVDHLVRLEADINIRDANSGRTILHHAVERRSGDFVKWLLNAHPHSLNIEATTYDGCSALKLAAGRDYGEIMNELLRCGADANTMLSDDSSSSESEEEQMDSLTEYDDFIIGGQPVNQNGVL